MSGVRGARVAVFLAAGLALSTGAAAQPEDVQAPTALGEPGVDLVFTPLPPCRIIDTRSAGGPIAAGTTRDFDVAGALSGQGGAPDCGVPQGRATAVAVNLVAVNPGGAGNLRAWAFGQPVPTASVINYGSGNIANAVVLPICNPAASPCTKDFTVQADVSATQLVADVVGYFHSPFVRTVVARPVPGDPLASGQALLATLAGINPGTCFGPGEDRWLLKVEPGVYDLGATTLAMKACVDMEGSGEATTRITRAGSDCPGFGSNVGTLRISEQVELRSLTVENTGGTNCGIAVYSESAGNPRITDVTIRASGALSQASGLRLQDASPEVSRTVIQVTGSPQSIGVFVIGTSAPILKDVDVAATGGSQNWAFIISSNVGFLGSTKIYRARAVGSTASLQVNANATAYVAHTQLEGPVTNTGTLTCLGVYDGLFLPAGCP
jgi:hypothetical protein